MSIVAFMRILKFPKVELCSPQNTAILRREKYLKDNFASSLTQNTIHHFEGDNLCYRAVEIGPF